MRNITDVTGFSLSEDSLEQLGKRLTETQAALRRALEIALPTVVAGLAALASSGNKAERFLSAIREGFYPRLNPEQAARFARNPEEASRIAHLTAALPERVFNGKVSRIVDTLAEQSGVRRESAATLLGVAGALAVDALEKQARSRRLDPRGISDFLADQRRIARRALPLKLASILDERTAAAPPSGRSAGTGAPRSRPRPAAALPIAPRTPRAPRVADSAQFGDSSMPQFTQGPLHPASEQQRRRRWLLGFTVIAGMFAVLGQRAQQSGHTASAPDRLPTIQPSLPETAQPAVAPEPLVAPPPTLLSAATGAGPLAQKLEEQGGTAASFVLEGVEFTPASSEVAQSSLLDAIAASLESYPNARVRLEAGVDAQAHPFETQGLAEDRAEAVKSYLIVRGVAPSRIDAVGRSQATRDSLDRTSAKKRDKTRLELVLLPL